MYIFSDVAVAELKRAGWFPARSVDTGKYVAFFEAEGFVWHEKALDFLREFGDLKLNYPLPSGIIQEISMDISDPNALSVANVENDSRILGIPLCPIAEVDEGFTRLEMSPTGDVYIRFQGTLEYAGASGEEVLDSLLSGNFWQTERPDLLPVEN